MSRPSRFGAASPAVRFTLNLTSKAAAMLQDLAADSGLDQADVLRVAIAQLHEEKFGRPRRSEARPT